jgi:hypothetical protein
MVEPCMCCDMDPMNEFNAALRKQFETINKKDVDKKTVY